MLNIRGLFFSMLVLALWSSTVASELPAPGTHISWPEVIDQGEGRVGAIERGGLIAK